MHKFLPLAAVILLMSGGIAHAQASEATRSVGHKGATQLGINFSTTTSVSTNVDGTTSSMTDLFGGIDVGRFVSDRFLVRFGVSGFGQVGGQEETFGGQTFGGSSVSFNFLTGALFYATPQKPQSLYVGGDVSVPMSKNGSGDPYVNGRVGIQAAIKANASFFVEAGYGAQMSSSTSGSGSNGSFQTNVGVRVLF